MHIYRMKSYSCLQKTTECECHIYPQQTILLLRHAYHIISSYRIYYIRLPILYQTSDMLYPTSKTISDVTYTISYFQYLYLTSNIILDVKYTISDLQFYIRCQIYYIQLPISYQTSDMLYPTSNIISDVRYTISYFLFEMNTLSQIVYTQFT